MVACTVRKAKSCSNVRQQNKLACFDNFDPNTVLGFQYMCKVEKPNVEYPTSKSTLVFSVIEFYDAAEQASLFRSSSRAGLGLDILSVEPVGVKVYN